MLAVALAIGAAFGWGTADFFGGFKSRSVRLVSVLLISQGTALAALSVVTIVRGANPPDGDSFVFAAIAGLSEALAIAVLYRGLAVGVMSVVAPIAAIAPVFPS